MATGAFVPGTDLADYRVTAAPPTESAENKVHDDDVARQLGFKGGLVPGVTVYAWMTRPVVERLGIEWLERGTFAVRFARPIYYGEPVTVKARMAAGGDGSVTFEVSALNPMGEACATARLGLAAEAPAARPDPAAYPAAPLPAERLPVSRELLASLGALGSPELDLSEATAADFLSRYGESLPLYAGPRAPAHPAIYLDQANRAIDRNVRVSPWIHVESDGRHLAVARVEERLSTRGRIARLFERKGHEFVELDLLVVAAGARPVAQVRHVAIYRLRHPSPG